MTLTDRRTPRLRSLRGLRRMLVSALALGLAAPLAVVAAPAAHAAEYGAPDEIAADYYGALLRHTRWTETVWDATAGVYQARDFNFAVVLGNAVLLNSGEYDANLAGISKDDLRAKTIATIEHYAALNLNVNDNGTWGRKLFWDSTFQSYFLLAGKLMWTELDETTRDNLTTIATTQSTYTADLDYGRDPLSGSWTADWPTGKYEGDTAAEEAGVYTQALAPGLAWAPTDPQASRWSEQLSDWGRNAAGQPTADRNNPAVVAGKPISSNTMQTIHDTYLVENHGSFGPHYQSDIWRSGGRNAIHFLLNDQPIPEILTRQPNSGELWESITLMMSDQGEPFMPMVADREFLYGRDVLPLAFLGQVHRDPDAVRAEANLAAALEDYQAYAPTDRLTKFSGEPKYEPEARAEIAISYLLHVEAAESDEGVVAPTPQEEFFERLTGVRDFGANPGITVQQSDRAWAAAASKQGFVKFPWVPEHNSWLFHVSGSSPYLYPRPGATVDTRTTSTYTTPRDGFEGTASLFTIGDGHAGSVTLPTGSAIYASSGAGLNDAALSVRNIDMNGYSGLDGSRSYTTAEGESIGSLPADRPDDPLDARAARVDDVDFAPVQARYVRMLGQQGHPQYGYSMFAFHVYGADAASGADLAAGRAVQASSEDSAGGRTAARVTDSDVASRWAVATSQRTRADSWLQVDLGSEQTVGSARFAWEASAGTRYLVQTSTDGTTWETQSAFGGAPADVNVARMDTVDLIPSGTMTPAPVEARYVRMQGAQGNPEYGYSLYHLRAFTPAGADAAAGRPATASSAEASRPASAVTDGSATTRWAVSREDRTRLDSWVQVDLGAPTAIAQVQLGWEAAAGREYRIQTSLDGETWVDSANFRFTGDEILSSAGSWLTVEGTAGFVVRGSDAPITVSRETDTRHMVRLADTPGGATAPLLVEMIPGDAEATAARADVAPVSVADPAVLASSLDGYLSLFNLSAADVTTTVTVPHTGDEVALFAGVQTVGVDSSTVEVTVPAGSALVLAPRFTLARPVADVSATVQDGRTLFLSAATALETTVSSVQTGEARSTSLTAGAAPAHLRFDDAEPLPLQDLALSALTFPASVLPDGMTAPALAVDGDATTAWVPAPNGRMVVDLGSPREIGTVLAEWDGDDVPSATVSVSDDGLEFTEIGATARLAVDVSTTARYVALSTDWSEGDAALTALRVLPAGVAAGEAPGPIEGDLGGLTVGSPATGTLASFGDPAPQFSVSAGELPPGVTLDAASGVFGGTPTEPGAFEFTVSATNGIGEPATRSFTVTVAPDPTDTGTVPPPSDGGGSVPPVDSDPADAGAGTIAVTGLDPLALALLAAVLLGAGVAALVLYRRGLRSE